MPIASCTSFSLAQIKQLASVLSENRSLSYIAITMDIQTTMINWDIEISKLVLAKKIKATSIVDLRAEREKVADEFLANTEYKRNSTWTHCESTSISCSSVLINEMKDYQIELCFEDSENAIIESFLNIRV